MGITAQGSWNAFATEKPRRDQAGVPCLQLNRREYSPGRRCRPSPADKAGAGAAMSFLYGSKSKNPRANNNSLFAEGSAVEGAPQE